MGDGVGPGSRAHGGGSTVSVAHGRRAGVGHRVFADPAGGGWGNGARAFPARARAGAGAGRCRHVELLLMAEQEIAPSKAPSAFGAFERLLLCVGPLVTLQVLEAGERALTGVADMRSRFVGLRGRQAGLGRSRSLRTNN